MEERHSKGLCMYCDEPFTPGHQLKHRRTELMVMELDDDEPVLEELTHAVTQDIPESSIVVSHNIDTPQLSVQALSGMPNYQTMRISALHNKKLLQILIDSGNTHNFLDLEMAKKLGCKLEPISPIQITAGGGHTLEAPFICKSFKWVMQQTRFQADVIVLPLVCCDLILGIQWLKTLGPIVWDFEKLQMEFSQQGRKFVLRGAKTSSLKVVNNKSFSQVVKTGVDMCFLSLAENGAHLFMPTCNLFDAADPALPFPSLLDHLLQQFDDIFSEPSTLPPPRPSFDHKIPIKEGTDAFNLRPYRYSTVQKNIIDKLVEEMFTQGIIQHSNSPYSSPIVLVRKKDGSWRLCVDFRRLNSCTIKDRFPIPLIEDLMDELGGASIFSKLDMRSGYHQLRMAIGEEHKTAFKIHSGHFEYLVMPFGLTNAPASFQELS
ncbi:unnamed protein product [Trifolium pratense]|uniref:Uncharacterized protein n=1 Tax=Trifolium pratense TaxID=57577 RepID=A0ACB0M1G0_TRIPR|nr:unnamed protein product [Trifolium pratense]